MFVTFFSPDILVFIGHLKKGKTHEKMYINHDVPQPMTRINNTKVVITHLSISTINVFCVIIPLMKCLPEDARVN